MSDQEKLNQIAAKILKVSDDTIESLACKQENEGLTDAEMYIALKHVLARFEKALGTKKINQYNSLFKFVDPEDYKEC